MSIETFLSSAQGGINLTQGMALLRHAASVDAGHVVEIGSYKGKSSVALCYGIHSAGRSGHIRLYCIDPHAPFAGELGGKFGPVDRRDFYVNMIQTGAFEHASLINLPALDVALAWKTPIGMLFIDGDHRYPMVREDFLRWLPHVLDGGIVAINDCAAPGLGPSRLVAELEALGFTPLERVEKIAFFRKVRTMPQKPPAPTWRSILVVAEGNVIAGGLIRFQRMHRALHPVGISFSMAFDDLTGPWRPSDIEMIGMGSALERQWDATILPGAGFSDRFIAGLGRFRVAGCGTRVQAVLNDRHRAAQFLEVNRQFAPHSVIFNTRDWVPGSYTQFQGDRFAIVEGAVDAAHFAPPLRRRARSAGQAEAEFVVGLQSKYIAALEALSPHLPPSVVFRVMGQVPTKALPAALDDLRRAGRLCFLGALDEQYLPAFYHGCDCILHLEVWAGWANLVAEAMACGVPVVCSGAGTAALTEGGATALIVDPADPAGVAAAILSVRTDPEAAGIRATRARAHVLNHDWIRYTARFIAAAQDDGRKHYLDAPERGLQLKWPLSSRLEGTEPLLALAPGANVLDIGCAEGIIAERLLSAGAQRVHGFDLVADRVGQQDGPADLGDADEERGLSGSGAGDGMTTWS
jgi:predicted O-methyltransferase YrrM